jgi:hypothetical protein
MGAEIGKKRRAVRDAGGVLGGGFRRFEAQGGVGGGAGEEKRARREAQGEGAEGRKGR